MRASVLTAHGRRGRDESDRPSLKRQSEVFGLAFVLLGGRRAANGFLDTVNEDLRCRPRHRAGTSVLGLVEVVRVLRRAALKSAHSTVQS